MKKSILCMATVAVLFAFLPNQLFGTVANTPLSTIVADSTKLAETSTMNLLMARLDEINAMDKSNMDRAEKRALRKEVRSIQREAKKVGGGVYISGGALLLILLLILILA